MLLRISAVLDLGDGLDQVFRDEYLASAQRLLPKWRREHKHHPLYKDGTFPIMGRTRVNTTRALDPKLDLVGTLVCAARNLVHLCRLYECRRGSL